MADQLSLLLQPGILLMNLSDEMTSMLKFDVELNLSGPSSKLLNKQAADILRGLAARLEKGEIEDGFIKLQDDNGNEVGQVYADYSDGLQIGPE